MPASFNTTDDAGARQSEEEFTEIPDETSKKPDSQVGSSFSKLMAEVGGAWRIFIFMSFTASLFAFIYMVILRYLGGVIIWVRKMPLHDKNLIHMLFWHGTSVSYSNVEFDTLSIGSL